MAVLPEPAPPALAAAIDAGGGVVVPKESAQALVWLGDDPARLGACLREAPQVTWVQLPWAGVEAYLPGMADGREWTCARGVYGPSVAEHALMLAMICLRGADRSARAGRWLPQPPVTLTGQDVLVVGGGSIAGELLKLLGPFGADVTVVRRDARAMPGATRVLPAGALDEALPAARVVVLAAALTPETRGLIGARRLRLMRADACLVNVARGELVVTDELVRALAAGELAAAGLDVTAPEPLPDGHPLWSLPNCFVTAHCADDLPYAMPAFAALVRENIACRAAGRPLRGSVDRELGY
ncbi:NAD(P)-dependent oxidoreductase [Nonomuraea sp. NPDC050643]|uniref:NAD(P)-dependent oxidoreductase n=1 Tax=Nonomuraea sp. NPDC050643 TaxID=3155660 RepID=UPI0033F2DF0B